MDGIQSGLRRVVFYFSFGLGVARGGLYAGKVFQSQVDIDGTGGAVEAGEAEGFGYWCEVISAGCGFEEVEHVLVISYWCGVVSAGKFNL